MLCHVAAVKCLPVHRHNEDYIFWSFGIQRIGLIRTDLSSLQLVLYHVAAINASPYRIIVQIIFSGPLGSLISVLVIGK